MKARGAGWEWHLIVTELLKATKQAGSNKRGSYTEWENPQTPFDSEIDSWNSKKGELISRWETTG